MGPGSQGCALTQSDACLDFSVRSAGKRSSLEKSLPEEKPGAELGWGGQGWAPADPVVRDFCGDAGLATTQLPRNSSDVTAE